MLVPRPLVTVSRRRIIPFPDRPRAALRTHVRHLASGVHIPIVLPDMPFRAPMRVNIGRHEERAIIEDALQQTQRNQLLDCHFPTPIEAWMTHAL